MHTKTAKWVIGAAIVMFIFSGTAWAGGKGGGRHGGGGKSYHSGHTGWHGPSFKHRGPGHKFGRYQHRPVHPRRHYSPRPHYRPVPRPYVRHHHRVRPYYGYRPYYRHSGALYGFSFSIMDPYFSLGFSTGGRW
jgi:hypothetical protein